MAFRCALPPSAHDYRDTAEEDKPFCPEMLNKVPEITLYFSLGLGTTGTSAIFLTTILALVAYLTITRTDQTPVEAGAAA